MLATGIVSGYQFRLMFRTPILAAIIFKMLLASPLDGQGAVIDQPLLDVLNDHCISCHNPEKKKGKLDLESILSVDMSQNLGVWDDVAWMLSEREMPPEDEPDVERPSESEFNSATQWLESKLETIAPDEGELTLSSKHALISEYCVSCHNADEKKGNLILDGISLDDPTKDPELWEHVVLRLYSRQMPPPDRERPSEATYEAVLASLTETLDANAVAHPKPGRVETFRRLNRTEYRNAIRDLVGLEIDADTLLPKDEESHGFDNVTVGTLSPNLLDRYISAAQKISRLAVGARSDKLQGYTVRLPADYTQEFHVEGLPIGTRGGLLLDYTFPQDGEYEVEVTLTRDRNEHVEGLKGNHEMEILLDRALVERFTVGPPKGRKDHSMVDKHLKTRVQVQAGPRKLGVTFLNNSYSLLENKREPFKAHFNHHRHPRLSPAVYQVSITGPYNAQGAIDTPSREKIFIRKPSQPSEESLAAREILENLMKHAYRRSTSNADLKGPMSFYREAAEESGFESGIEAALSSILVNPEFLFRVEHEPAKVKPGQAYRISDIELASRLSFFIWSSLPDEALIDDAIAGNLSDPDTLEAHVRRMLADPRALSLVDNFASQWLHLRNLDSVTPDLRLYPDFDDNLRQAFRKETELFIEGILTEDRPVLEMLKADYTYLNERLAHHYGVPNVFGSRFRRVELEPEHHRGGLLRQGSILTVTSYATRTSPVIRGNWVLENIIGTAPPPPPADVPALEENTVDATLSVRERLEEHRANPACASCHDLMDPVGFALENFDAIGRWREFEYGAEIDVSGGLPDGSVFDGVANLENGLLERPELFVRALSEKLLTFALGRGVEAYDAPAVRKIIAEAQANDYRFSSMILGIVKSVPFQMRTKSEREYTLMQHTERKTP